MPKRHTSLAEDAPKVRQSISFTQRQHDVILAIAEKSHVSFGWVVRYACDRLIVEREGQPLLPNLAEDSERMQSSEGES